MLYYTVNLKPSLYALTIDQHITLPPQLCVFNALLLLDGLTQLYKPNITAACATLYNSLRSNDRIKICSVLSSHPRKQHSTPLCTISQAGMTSGDIQQIGEHVSQSAVPARRLSPMPACMFKCLLEFQFQVLAICSFSLSGVFSGCACYLSSFISQWFQSTNPK